MRSCGRVVATLLLILFILHSILGATSLTGLSNIGLYPLLLAFQIILAVHIVIGAVYTYRSLHGGQINYWHLNKNLWIRRLSGLLVLIAALCHAYLFDHLAFLGMQTRTALYTATNLILLVSLFVHIKYNAAAYIIAHIIIDASSIFSYSYVSSFFTSLLQTFIFTLTNLRQDVEYYCKTLLSVPALPA